MMDLDALLAAHGDDAPSGENLEYDADFLEMEIAAQPGEERQAGDRILAAEDPDYPEVVAKALAVMGRSHDLRAGVTLADAVIRTGGLPGFRDATAYLRGCLEDWWDSCHPQLDADDDDDPTMRVNAMRGLASPDTVLRGLRDVALSDSRTFGRLSLRDVMIAHGELPPREGETPQSVASVAAAFEDTDPDRLADTVAALRESMANIRAIDTVFGNEIPGRGPDYTELLRLLQTMQRHLVALSGAAQDTDPAEDAEDADFAQAGAAPAMSAPARGAARAAPGAIESPADVTAALDAIVAYYGRCEPSSPLPLILLRARRLVNADFLTIVKDLAPSGLDNVNLVGGIDDDD